MTADFQSTESDYISAHTAWLKRHPFSMLRSFWYPIAILVLMGMAAADAGADRKAAVIGVLIAVVYIIVSLLVIRWRWHRTFIKTAWMQQPASLTLDEQGVKLKGLNFENREDWKGIKTICETPGLFLFFMPDKRFYFLPKRGMSEMQIAEIRSIVSMNAQGSAKLAAASM